jgi:hypothetical protein
MKPTDPHGSDALHHDDVAHEHSDVNIRAVITSAVVISVVCIGTAGLMYLLMMLLESQAEARDPKLSPLSMPATQMPPTTIASPTFGSAPEPRLMTNEPMNLEQVREHLRNQLSSYAWVDEKAGIARIPIDEAKKLVIEQLPVRPDPIADPRLGTHAPAYGEASSGRTITQAPAASEPAGPAPAPPAAATEHKAPERK